MSAETICRPGRAMCRQSCARYRYHVSTNQSFADLSREPGGGGLQCVARVPLERARPGTIRPWQEVDAEVAEAVQGVRREEITDI